MEYTVTHTTPLTILKSTSRSRHERRRRRRKHVTLTIQNGPGRSVVGVRASGIIPRARWYDTPAVRDITRRVVPSVGSVVTDVNLSTRKVVPTYRGTIEWSMRGTRDVRGDITHYCSVALREWSSHRRIHLAPFTVSVDRRLPKITAELPVPRGVRLLGELVARLRAGSLSTIVPWCCRRPRFPPPRPVIRNAVLIAFSSADE